MSVNTELIARAWKRAAEDLGIEVIAPYLVELPDGGTKQFVALVRRFGSATGMLIDVISPTERDTFHKDYAIAEKANCGFSELNPDVYSVYDRDVFIEALLDWGWTDSENEPPKWYQEQIKQQSELPSHPTDR